MIKIVPAVEFDEHVPDPDLPVARDSTKGNGDRHPLQGSYGQSVQQPNPVLRADSRGAHCSVERILSGDLVRARRRCSRHHSKDVPSKRRRGIVGLDWTSAVRLLVVCSPVFVRRVSKACAVAGLGYCQSKGSQPIGGDFLRSAIPRCTARGVWRFGGSRSVEAGCVAGTRLQKQTAVTSWCHWNWNAGGWWLSSLACRSERTP